MNPPDTTSWLRHRAAGVLLHPTCFPGDFGVGTLGVEARQFIDFLAEAGLSYWQVCPLGPTGYGDSPYQSTSAFAGNPYLIDLLPLTKNGWVRAENLGPLVFLPHDRVDFGGLYKLKWSILSQAFEGFRKNGKRNGPLSHGDFEKFKARHADWLDPFSWYHALKAANQGKPWCEWPEEIRSWERLQAGRMQTPELEEAAEAQKFYQFLFHAQWAALRQHAKARRVKIIGDIPIFVSFDSSDVWAQPGLFQLDKSGRKAAAMAGVPPDYFSSNGQFWGNPLFNWDAMAKDGYQWWMRRLRASFHLCDVVRIDHFRGFEAYWSIPHGAKTAKEGKWVKGPGEKFFKAVAKEFPSAPIIAEDLGTLTPEVFDLLDSTGFPGMSVLQFAFGGEADNPYLPHNHKANSVVYPGTHDNDTTLGWYRSIDEPLRDHIRRYFRISGAEIPWDFARACYRSVGRLAILPLQDLMNLDSKARFNTPGREMGNWQWRYSTAQLEKLRRESGAYLRELGELYDRIPTAESDS